jgi:hypothetical protein
MDDNREFFCITIKNASGWSISRILSNSADIPKSEHNIVAKTTMTTGEFYRSFSLITIPCKLWSFLQLVTLLMLISACSTAQTPLNHPPSPDPIQAFVDANSSQATAVAAIATADYHAGQLTGTVVARNQSATQQAYVLTVTQQSIQIQGTERSWVATSTADAIHSATIASQTASAAVQQAIWTQRAIDVTATADAAAVQAYSTQQYAEARSEELALERAQLMNGVAAVVPWAVLIAFFAVGFLIALRWSRVRIIQRDQRGDAPLLINVVDGVAYDADRQPTGAGGLLRSDVNNLPKLTSGDYLQTTTRDQMVDLKTRGLPGASHRPRLSDPNAPKQSLPMINGEAPQVQLLDEKDALPLMHDVLPAILRDAIDAEIISDEPMKGETT